MITDVRSAIIDAIKTGVPGLEDHVEPHGGRFDLEELKRLAQRSPSMLVACLGVVSARANSAGETEAVCKWAAFVLTTDKRGVARDVGVLALVAAVLPVIPDNCWGVDGVNSPKNIRADNLFSTALDKIGVALWAITWDQEITLGGLDEGSLDLFALMHVDWDLAPPDGTFEAVDDVELEQE
ncbi:conserved hypothetical protein [uncultured Desulfobacterium sp.]|uniref:DUF1834 family protein n=1 Tax=uncultured Desulfobacterium sp. TaxID=201089 RepID=A0A445MWJ6_9BACT|nr:conserved hypothetical protein [uncultured Desulfobacterium sp.]